MTHGHTVVQSKERSEIFYRTLEEAGFSFKKGLKRVSVSPYLWNREAAGGRPQAKGGLTAKGLMQEATPLKAE